MGLYERWKYWKRSFSFSSKSLSGYTKTITTYWIMELKFQNRSKKDPQQWNLKISIRKLKFNFVWRAFWYRKLRAIFCQHDEWDYLIYEGQWEGGDTVRMTDVNEAKVSSQQISKKCSRQKTKEFFLMIIIRSYFLCVYYNFFFPSDKFTISERTGVAVWRLSFPLLLLVNFID